MTDPTDLIAQADAALGFWVKNPARFIGASRHLVPALRDALAAALTRAANVDEAQE